MTKEQADQLKAAALLRHHAARKAVNLHCGRLKSLARDLRTAATALRECKVEIRRSNGLDQLHVFTGEPGGATVKLHTRKTIIAMVNECNVAREELADALQACKEVDADAS